MALESVFQASVIKEIRQKLPGSLILKNDAKYIQGIPDLLILYQQRWAMLEVKQNEHSSVRPNQIWYVNKIDDMSFARFIFPENKDSVLLELYVFLTTERRIIKNENRTSDVKIQ